MSWLAALFHADDREADSLIVAGLVAMLAMIGLSVFVTVQSPATFSPINFGTATAAIMAGMGGARQLRDFRRKDDPPCSPPSN